MIQTIIDTILDVSTEIEELIRSDSTCRGTLINSTNFSGDEQKPLDVLTNDMMIDALTKTNLCSILLSEENEDAIVLHLDSSKHMVAFDPLDGSSNIDCNVCIGTIFSIYETCDSSKVEDHILRNGDHLVAAGYILYGPATEAVIATSRSKCVKYSLDPHTRKYKLSSDKVDLSSKSKKIYSINEGNALNWFPKMETYINQFKASGNYTQRYIGSMVADVHRTLMYGGMFCYPDDKKNTKGKLRLIYECFPMAFVTEAANGLAIDCSSMERILCKFPKEIHERTPILLGSSVEVSKFG
jgi:fructose-1,6-bisphosphatase I